MKFLILLIISLFCIIYHDLLSVDKIFIHDSIVWYGQFHYYLESLIDGHFPFWDPYLIGGTPFYPNINFARDLDPLMFLPILLVKVLGVNTLTSFIYFCLFELVIFVIGAFYLFEYITGCRKSAVVSSGILLFSITPTSLSQFGVVTVSFLTPFALYFLLLFFDNIKNQKKYLYLFCFVLIFGISINMNIPVYFLFNISIFLIVIFAVRIVNIGEVVRNLYDSKSILFLFLSAIILIMMAAPLFALYKDSKGEIFPSVRIIQKNNGNFKKIMASEYGDSVLSDKFYKQMGIYNSYGNILNLIYPDMYKPPAVKKKLTFFDARMAETLLYIGIIPFVFSIIGLIYGKSRRRCLAITMLILIFVNMFSFHAVVAQPNFVQKIFNILFPPLKMVDVKEVFSSFFLLYLTMLLSMGLKIFFDKEEFMDLIRKKSPHIIAICFAVLLVKSAITGYFWGKLFFTSTHDLFVLVLLLLFIILILCQYLMNIVGRKLFCGLILLLMFADIAYYNIEIKPYALQKNTIGPLLSEKTTNKTGEQFEYFRIPFLYAPIAFGETIFKIKGAMPRGHNHHMFTTKRYYDYITHVPLGNQFILSGLIYPIIRFYPNDKIKVFKDKRRLLDYFSSVDDPWMLEKYLFIEENETKGAGSIGRARLQDINQFEDVSWLRPDYIMYSYSEFLHREQKRFKEIRKNLNQYLATQEYQLTVEEFNPNGITISVKNQIDGYLYYNDGWSEYWRAYDGGREIPIKTANYNFKAVFLEKGAHVIKFVYAPIHYRLGLILYLGGFLFAFIIICYIKIRWKYLNVCN